MSIMVFIIVHKVKAALIYGAFGAKCISGEDQKGTDMFGSYLGAARKSCTQLVSPLAPLARGALIFIIKSATKVTKFSTIRKFTTFLCTLLAPKRTKLLSPCGKILPSVVSNLIIMQQ